ncbi:MAG: hypothetical protein RLZZ15_2125, partial [Verrucomicrobiota bacterium]
AVEAWDIQPSADNVIVAMIDSGVRTNHEDLGGNLWRNPGETGSGSLFNVDDDRNSYIDDINGINSIVPLNATGGGDPSDDNGHGTATASVVGAVGNNGVGMAGVAWRVQLMALKFLDSTGSGFTSDEIECLDYAIAKKAQIINCSFGGSNFSQALFDAFKRTRDAGIIVVCSAGNNGVSNDTGVHYPSNYQLDNIVAVANTTRTDTLAASSNYGSGTVDLGAPGTTILTASNAGSQSYAFVTGTSFSAPMVTGALALVKAKFPTETYRQHINRILRSVDPLPALAGKSTTGGRLNVAAALRATVTRPFNDDFAQRSALVGESLAARSASQLSTRETGEPNHAGLGSGGGSLWWTWTAPRSGSVSIDTAGSAFDTVLAVYTGSTVGALTSAASNDDAPSTTTSKVTFTAVAGTAYQIAVDRKSGDAGLAVVNVSLLSSNDAFDSAQLVTGLSWAVTGDNRTATRETGEPRIRNNAGGHSVWYKWVAPTTRRYYVGTFSSDFNTMLAVFTGADLASLTEVTSALNGGDSNATLSAANVSFTATAGTTYYIAVDNEVTSTSTTAGTFTLNCIDSNWEFHGNGGPTTVAVAPDGTLHTTDTLGYIYALDPDGFIKWRYFMTGFGTYSAPAVGPDGTVYAGDDFFYLHAVTPTGTRKWRTALNAKIDSPPAIAADGTIYVRPDDGKLYALAPDTGIVKWNVTLGTSATTSYAAPSIGPDGTIYTGSAASKLYAINPNGTVKWTYSTDFILSSPAIAPDGTVYFGTSAPGNRLVALNSDGTVKWSFPAAADVSSSPTIAADGTIYFGSVDKNLYAITPNGTLRWSLPVGNTIRNTAPTLASDGSIFIGCDDGKVYAANSDGTLRRTYATANALRASPLLLNGKLLIPSFDYRLYAVDVGLVPATSPWPMHRQNPRRIGRLISTTLAIGVQPRSQTIPDGSSATFAVAAVGTGTIGYQWRLNGTAVRGATATSYTVDGANAANAGQYSVVVTDSAGSLTSANATLTVTPVAPVVVTQPRAAAVIAGSAATLSVSGSGTGPFTYQWLRNGSPISGATSATLSLSTALVADAGSYTVTITNAVGSATSQAAVLAVAPADFGRLLNLSIFTTLTPGETFDVGTVLGGAGSGGQKPVLVRAMGPTLAAAPFSIPGVVVDPKLDIFTGGTVAVTNNDNWAGSTALTTASTQVGAFAFSNANSKDAALVFTANAASPPTSFTARISDLTAAGGLVLAEFYDATPPEAYTIKTPHLINMSVLKPIRANLAAGFVIGGANPITVLIRAVGPTLATAFGVGGTIEDPKLEVADSAKAIVAANDNWGGTAALTTAFAQVGAFPLSATSKDAAVLVTLKPGNYNVQVTPASGATGTGLVEIYEVP